MRKDDVWNWTLPAWVVRGSDGRAVNVCPNAGGCVRACYALAGKFKFPGVRASHMANLEFARRTPGEFAAAMVNELDGRRFRRTREPRLPGLPRGNLSRQVTALLDGGAACVRVHDSGDFFSEEYLLAWLTVAALAPHVLFYCYTKEVALFKRVAEGAAPGNFLWCYSLGGKQDGLVDRERDRHADVFPDPAAIAEAGYYSQAANDLLCVVAPSLRIGIPANNLPHLRRVIAGRTFSRMEADRRAPGRRPLPTLSGGPATATAAADPGGLP